LKQVAIVGGGLAGLITAIELTKKGVPCRLFEKKVYPFHRVCGEYISNETVPYLKKGGLYPEKISPSQINNFQLSSVRGQTATMPLDLGGFGASRYAFDHYLFEKAKAAGVDCHEGTEVNNISFADESFTLHTPATNYHSDVVVGTFGKRSRLDIQLKRDFISRRSPYVAVKYHVKTEHAGDLIALHNFPGGYCGTVGIENDIVNVCYLAKRDALHQYGSIPEMEERVLFRNPLLKGLWKNADFIFQKPLVINEVSFATKEPVLSHILMSGDAAGMIAPLCGNGMAIAIHTAKLVSDIVFNYCTGTTTRKEMEDAYREVWRSNFSFRLRMGRWVQRLFGSDLLSDMAVRMMLASPSISRQIMKRTHGSPF
jgi:menaquinone-9 beta-reductase